MILARPTLLGPRAANVSRRDTLGQAVPRRVSSQHRSDWSDHDRRSWAYAHADRRLHLGESMKAISQTLKGFREPGKDSTLSGARQQRTQSDRAERQIGSRQWRIEPFMITLPFQDQHMCHLQISPEPISDLSAVFMTGAIHTICSHAYRQSPHRHPGHTVIENVMTQHAYVGLALSRHYCFGC